MTNAFEQLDAQAKPLVREPSGLVYHFVAAVDIAGFSRLHTAEQVAVQADLTKALEIAAAAAGLDRELWNVQVSGDGELAVLPPGIDGSRLVADYPRELERALAVINRTRRPAGRLRIRVALHHGPVAAGLLGPAGTAPIVVMRLLDTDALRDELRHRVHEDLVLIVSRELHDDVIRSRFRGLDPAAFFPVEQRIKDQVYAGYIHRERPAVQAPRAGPTTYRGRFIATLTRLQHRPARKTNHQP
jgi:hypothetical protein